MENQIITQVALHLNKDEEAVTTIKKKSVTPSFYRIGKGTTNMKGIKSIDLLLEMSQMTKVEQAALLTIRDAIVWDNPDGEVYLTFDDKQKQKKFLEGFKLLEAKDLVRRTKRSHYMINPTALVPLDFTKAMNLWNELKSKEN